MIKYILKKYLEFIYIFTKSNNKFVNTNDYINNTNYINNKNDNLIINENLFIDNEERKELTLNSLKYDNLLTLLQDSEDYLENSFDIDNKNYF